jgi:DNA (cytosine-5)-methyltransferase 1
MTVLSLFSGAGGLDLGLIKAGNAVVWANDVDAHAVETYKKTLAVISSVPT